MAPEVIRYEDWKLTWLKLVNLLVLIQGWDRVNVASSLGKHLRGFQEVSLHSPGLDWASLNRGLVQGQLSILMLALGKYMIFAKSLKVRKLPLALPSMASMASSSQGMGDL